MFNYTKRCIPTFFREFYQTYTLTRFIGMSCPTLKNSQVIQNNISMNNIPMGVMGQPTCHTHPHLVRSGELVHGLTVTEFVNRRSEFMNKLCTSIPKEQRNKGHIVVIPSSEKNYMSDKIPYIFRQNSDFYYLTGCNEPDSVLIMTCLPDCENIHKTILLLRGKDEHSELWDGPRTSFDDAIQMFKVDVALPYEELCSFLTTLLTDNKNIFWYSPGAPLNQTIDKNIKSVLNKVKTNPPVCPRRILSNQRLLKSSAEIKLMIEACKIGSSAINNAMSCTKPGLSEHDIHASIDYWCRRSGAEHLAFPPVIGGGNRATSIHYIHDNQILSNGELLLVDAGCQNFYYNSDITRTWPVSGKFSSSQAILYDIIYTIQNALLSILKEQRPTLDNLFDIMCTLLGTYLREEGIIPKSTSDSQLLSLAFKYCPHHVSHYLGIDVHDTPCISRNIHIIPGMVITIEPGIYISHKDDLIPKEFRGIGIRIEDDVLITSDEPLVLTQSCLKNRNDIEKIVGTKTLPQ